MEQETKMTKQDAMGKIAKIVRVYSGWDIGEADCIRIATALLEKCVLIEELPEKKNTFGARVDIFRAPNLGFNEAIKTVKEIPGRRGDE